MPESQVPDFERYKEMQTEIENNIMGRLHPTLEGLLNGQNQLSKSIEKMGKKVDLMYGAYTMAQKFGTFAEWVAKNTYKIILGLGALGLSVVGIRDAHLWEILKRIFGR